MQVGGDASAREGWRIAVSMLYDIYKDREKTWEMIRKLDLCDDKNAQVQFTMIDKNINAVRSTSAGRLFDAVSAILQVRKASTFEGEASTTLEFVAEAYEENCLAQGKRPLEELEYLRLLDWTPEIFQENGSILPTKQLVEKLAEAFLQEMDPGLLAFWFHERLAEMVRLVCVQAKKEYGIHTVALSGGVYQNQLLVRLSCEKLKKDGFQVLTHSLLPPNDGGIALGQAVVAMQRING